MREEGEREGAGERYERKKGEGGKKIKEKKRESVWEGRGANDWVNRDRV